MAIPFLNNINLSDNELQNAKLHITGTAPTEATGQIYYDSSLNVARYYDDDGWVRITDTYLTSGTFVSATLSGTNAEKSYAVELSATGTPSTSTFLRGDNTWATPPGGTDTTYTISSAQNGSAANIRLTGSDGGQNIVTLIAGANITLTDNGSNAITIASTASGGGGACCSVNAGNGLKIESGTPASNPVIGVDYVGSNNFILKGQSYDLLIKNVKTINWTDVC